MSKFFLSIFFFFAFLSSSWAGKISDFGNEIATHPDNTTVAVKGADLDGGVSRIVFDGIPSSGYSVKPANNKLHIMFPNFSWSFLKDDMNNLVFLNNIDKFELNEQKDGLAILTINYKCNCQADVYTWKDRKLVLDIFGLEAVGNPTKTRAWKERQETQIAKAKAEKERQKNSANKDVSNKDNIETASIPPQNTPQAEPPKNDFQSQLKALLAAAGNQGVVKFKQGEEKTLEKIEEKKPEEKKEEELSEDDPLYFPKAKEKLATSFNPSNANGVQKIAENIQVSQSNVLTEEETEKLLPDEDVFIGTQGKCLPDGAFKLPQNDPETETFYDELTKYRSQVVGEFDKTNSERSLDLAYHYISYGLGEEAVNVLDNFGAPENRGYIARSMAELLTSAPPSKNSMFATKKNCADVHGLWSAYYYYKMGDERRAAALSDIPEIGSSLAKLPVVLQRQLGTALALNLVRKGTYKTAESLMNQVARISYQFDPSVLLVRGLIDAKNGFSDRALGTLEDVMSKTTGLDQQLAGLSLSELKLAMGVPLTQRDMSALEELVFLKARELVGAQALALIAENESRFGNFHKAFRRLSKNVFQQNGIKDPVMIKAEQLFRRLAISSEGIDNPNNLRIYYEFPKLLPDNPALHIGFAKQLAKLGHDRPAYKILNETKLLHPEYFSRHDQTYFMGKLLFRMGLYTKTVEILDRPYLDDKEYMTLKAEALNKIGQHQEAFEALAHFKDAQSNENKARYALDAKEWAVAKTAYENANRQKSNDDYYYGAKAAGYMSGYDYPGNALEYKNDVDVVFHQPNKQATAIDGVVEETKHLINLMQKRHKKLLPLFDLTESKATQKS